MKVYLFAVTASLFVPAVVAGAANSDSGRTTFSLNADWKFTRADRIPVEPCASGTWTQDASNVEVLGLHQVQAITESLCAEECCNDPTCQVYQYCNSSDCGSGPPQQASCWVGVGSWPSTHPSKGWIGKARPPSTCTWTTPLVDERTLGLTEVPDAKSADDCEQACCGDSACETYQWCNVSTCDDTGCWVGKFTETSPQKGWIGGAREVGPVSLQFIWFCAQSMLVHQSNGVLSRDHDLLEYKSVCSVLTLFLCRCRRATVPKIGVSLPPMTTNGDRCGFLTILSSKGISLRRVTNHMDICHMLLDTTANTSLFHRSSTARTMRTSCISMVFKQPPQSILMDSCWVLMHLDTHHLISN